MANQPPNYRYKELLDELQLQSWQLELVISGFAIFGLFSALEPLFDWYTLVKLKQNFFLRWLSFSIWFACILTIVNLIIHVLLRGLWIGAVGIRSVSGEIEFDKLGFSSDITDYLKGRIGSFDSFIERLETYSSIMFGISFITIFMTLGFFINFALLMFSLSLIFEEGSFPVFRIICALGLGTVLFIIYLITFVDFITRGIFKKLRGKFILTLYRISSILTLSIFYRPLLYNLWDNKFGKKLMKWLVPFYVIGILGFSSTYVSTHYFSTKFDEDHSFPDRMKYWDMLEEQGDHITYAAIPSKTITTPFLDLSIDYEKYIEDMIYEYDPSLRPLESRIGYKSFLYSGFGWEFGGPGPTMAEEAKMLKTINTVFTTRIDDILFQEPFEVTEEKNKSIYLKKYLDISNLKNGRHLLTIQRLTSKNDSTKIEHYETIPFWYFPD